MRFHGFFVVGLIGGLVACSSGGDGDDEVKNCLEPIGAVAFELQNGAADALYLTGIDTQVVIVRQDGEEWHYVNAELGCVSTCDECEQFACEQMLCSSPREVPAGESYHWSWSGWDYRLAADKCAGREGQEVTCVEELCAPAGHYKVRFCYRTQPLPESDEGVLEPDCLARAGLEGVALEQAVCVEHEFDFPGETKVVVAFP